MGRVFLWMTAWLRLHLLPQFPGFPLNLDKSISTSHCSQLHVNLSP